MKIYFAYGSNMNEARMKTRCPSAICLGKATLHGYRLVERLYADIQRMDGASVEGMVWAIDDTDLARLDAFEGVAKGIYARRTYTVEHHGQRKRVTAYEMTDATRKTRDGIPDPEWYRQLCARGAMEHRIRNEFEIGA